jgi:anti-sigma regulatory factor (Ser/Thr protein kinase)
MPTVRLAFSPFAAHVRTARLVGVAVARRAGVADDLLDEVRLAVGEACSRAVALHRRHKLTDLIRVELSTDGHYRVRVTDRAPIDAALGTPLTDPGNLPDPVSLLGTAPATPAMEEAEEEVAAGMGIALLAGLVDELSVVPGEDGIGTQVLMSWPVHPRR